ncbi:hypothetical protein [Novosphingobium sp.]|uniref:hypothetical protein n=1 Tax=Novosphingobium sp. TaxID=1874826 RepID=UPI003D0FB24E
MAMGNVDLTTRMGAHTATRTGSYAAFTFAVLGLLGALVYGFVIMKTNPGLAKGATIGGLVEAVMGTIAGWRLRMGKGLFWGGATLFMVALELIGKVVAVQFGGLAIDSVVAIYLFNGLRGAYVLRQGRFAEDEAEVFG